MITTELIARRKKLSEHMDDGSFYFVHSGSEMESTHDECYIFEPYRNFYYLTGIDQPESILLIVKNHGIVSETLLMHVPTPMEQRWMNRKWNPDKIIKETGIQKLQTVESFDNIISRILFYQDIQTCYVDIARMDMHYSLNHEQRIINRLKEVYPYLNVKNAYSFICDQRTVKSPCEIEEHRKAVEITAKGVANMLVHMKPGMKEYEIEAYYDFVLKSNGVKKPAFTTIAAAGTNANHMHYMDNDAVAKEGDLILFDLGARSHYYCADVSRTYPVNGKFSERQKLLYNVVLKGLKAAEEASKPGVIKDELQQISKRVMAEELVRIGKINSPEEISKYYMHSSGHFIGLDTHDVGDHDIILAKDMMFTLEPGLYFDDEGMGIRIEDTILVTENGIEILSDSIPKEIEDIEKIMQNKN